MIGKTGRPFDVSHIVFQYATLYTIVPFYVRMPFDVGSLLSRCGSPYSSVVAGDGMYIYYSYTRKKKKMKESQRQIISIR